MLKQPFMLKGEMTLLNVLMLQSSDLSEINTLLQQKRIEVSQLLSKSPVIVDCQAIHNDCQNLNLELLHSIIVEADFVPVGLRNLPEDLEPDAINVGWAILRRGGIVREPMPQMSDQYDTENEVNSPPARTSQRLILLDKPVRSGQQIYAQDGDIVVLQQTSAGSELLAAGSVHVYGPLRGRVLAGIHGDVSARIFCQKLEAELVAIAGRYRLLEDDNPLRDKPAMIYLEGEKLIIDPMF